MAKKIKQVNVFAPKKASDKPYAQKDSKKAPDKAILDSWWNFGYEAARKKHWDFFVIDQFLRGNHNVRGNPEDNSIEFSKKAGAINYPINKVFSTFRAVRAFVTRHKPQVEVEPEESSDAARDYARRANKLLDRDNQLNNYRKLNKEWVYYGVKYGLGWRQIGYDQQKKCAIRWTVDPFDLLVGSKTGKAADAPYLIKDFVRTIEYWRNKYPKANVVPDNEIAAAEYKRLAMQMTYQDTHTSSQPLDQQTAIGHECWYRLYEPNSLGGLVNKVVFTKTEIVDFQETPYDEFPFIPYESEIIPNEVYPDGQIKHVISPQRMFNLLNTQLLEYNHIVNRGRFLMDKNAGFKSIFAKEGQIITKNQGKMVSVLNPPAVNPVLTRQLDMALEFIQDLGGQHDASLGSTPERVTSGKAIENLQLGDSNNISDLRDNFEDALSLEATWILKMYSLFETEGVVLSDELKGGEMDKFGVVGAKAYEDLGKPVPEKYFMEDNGEYCATCAILPENHVKVSVNSQLGETKEARLDLLLRLVTEAGLPAKFVFEYLEFPNTTDILERVAEEAAGAMAMNGIQAQMSQPPMPPGTEMGGEPPPPPPPPENPEDLAALEDLVNQSGGMVNG